MRVQGVPLLVEESIEERDHEVHTAGRYRIDLPTLSAHSTILITSLHERTDLRLRLRRRGSGSV